MNCLYCRDLKRVYEVALCEYTEARSSLFFQVCLDVAAQKNVDMERAWYELEEHRLVCGKAVALATKQGVSTKLKQLDMALRALANLVVQ